MRAVVQRVKSAELSVGGKVVSKIGAGLCVYLGIKKGDETAAADYIAKKIVNLRIFTDKQDKMNLSVADTGGEILLISQFTLYGDASHGNRPSFIDAEVPDKADKLYEYTAEKIFQAGIPVKKGVFGADMQIQQHNDGPVTIILEEKNHDKKS